MQQNVTRDEEEALRLDQEELAPKREPIELSAADIVVTFPDGKATVKGLIKDCEAWLEEHENHRQTVREFLSSKVSMFDIDFATALVMVGRYGNQKEIMEDRLKRLRNLWRLYAPPKKSADGITDWDIERAKQYPIKELVKVNRMNKARCAWHTDKHPSMHVYPDGHVYCFACHSHGDVIALYQQLNGCDFKTAVRHLARV